MKVDKTNFRHWLLLARFGVNIAIAILLRPFISHRKADCKLIVLYGHKLSGNLLAIYRHLRIHGDGIHPVFLTMDTVYHYRLDAAGELSCLAVSPACIRLLAHAEAVISDHGLHALQPMLSLSNLKFFDVWHGIPFKGFDSTDFRVQHHYDETWVSSPLMAELYINRFGFDKRQVVITGYARTDCLIQPGDTPEAIRQRLGLAYTQGRKLVLFAPTWKQDAQNRSLFPFGVDTRDFLDSLTAVCRRQGALLLFRAHLNAGNPVLLSDEGVIPLPFADYPDTEAVLQISNVLICDWSSIAFDYLLLDRPTLFLDVEPPFRKGFSLGPEYRFGPVVNNLPDLLSQLERSLADPSGYQAEFGPRYAAIRKQVYGSYADGHAAERCIERLRQAFVVSQRQ